ncbi:MAG: aldo/keto reductase, partial [Pseudomonadota bacterium]
MTKVAAAVERREIAPGYSISRLLKGGWQLAGDHGPVEHARAVDDMLAFVDAGITCFDCADIYTGVEELIGAFLARLAKERGAEARAQVKVHTKYVPDIASLATLQPADVAAVIDRSLLRLGVDRLDLVQFHWWDYAMPGWLE